MERNVVFIGGGTEGHLRPAQAVAEQLKESCADIRVKFVLSGRDTEMRCFAGTDVAIEVLPTAGWNQSVLGKVGFLARAPLAAHKASRMFARLAPDVVVCMGGYASVVPVLVAQAKGIPTMLFESNVIPGRVTRLLARHADEVQVQFHGTLDRIYKHKGIVTGNPVRKRIFSGDVSRAYNTFSLDPGKRTLLVMGGSQGAQSLNQRVSESLRLLAPAADRLQILHLTGPSDEAETRRAYEGTAIQHAVVGYLRAMEDAYAITDLALCRSGGSSLAELTALGIPSILVPYPHAVDDHQHYNALELVKSGAAWLIDQANLAPEVLAHSVTRILDDPAVLGAMKRASGASGHPDAARIVADRILSLAGVPANIQTIEDISNYPNQLAA